MERPCWGFRAWCVMLLGYVGSGPTEEHFSLGRDTSPSAALPSCLHSSYREAHTLPSWETRGTAPALVFLHSGLTLG